MKVLVFGYGLNGVGFDSAMYFLSHGDQVRITDLRERELLGESIDYLEKKGAEIHCGGYCSEDFTWADMVLKNPTIRNENGHLELAKRVENDLTYAASIELVHDAKLICVTGAHGKTTTASAICHAINYMGKKAHMCGNMGVSAFSELRLIESGDIPDYIVLELSMWQARDTYKYLMGKIPFSEVSVITSVFERKDDDDDLGRLTGEFNIHSNHIICPQLVKDHIKKIAQNKTRNVSSIDNVRGMSKSLPQNMAPSYAVLRKLGFSSSQVNEALKSFKGIPNRSELILRTNTTMYINDSSSTIPAAVSFTMDNLEAFPINLICGGSDSSMDPTSMLRVLEKAASIHLLDGSFTQKRLIPLLRENGIVFNGPFTAMEDAVSSAESMVDQTSSVLQVVLLCPGAAAFEHYSNEHTRGEAFSSIVKRRSEDQTETS